MSTPAPNRRKPTTGTFTVAERKALQEQIEAVVNDNAQLKEALDQVAGMFRAEDKGWERFGPTDVDGGMTYEDIRKWAHEIRESIVGNPWMKAGIRLRCSYIFQNGGIQYANIPANTDGRSPNIPNVQALIDDPINQAQFFGMNAHKEREEANYSDGNVFYLGDDMDHTIEFIPMDQIDAQFRNPDNPGIVWAYRRTWTPAGGKEQSVWYFSDTYKSKSSPTIKVDDEAQRVDQKKTIFPGRVNTQAGWANGIPDAVAALVWSRLWTDFMKNGKIMTDALAQFAFQATVGTKAGATAVGLQMAKRKGAGQTAVTGAADSLVPLSSAGRGYDFASGVPLLAAVATAIGVSVIHLSADPGTAGGSYGSASTLDLPTMLATNDRRDWHIEFDLRVLRWMGAKDAHAYFAPLAATTDILRAIQSWAAMFNTGLYSAAEVRGEFDKIMGLLPGTPPVGVMLPNNEKYPDTLTNDDQTQTAKNAAAAASATSTPSAATGKGKSTGAGTGPKSNDKRTDTLSNSAQHAELVDMVAELSARVERLIAA